MVRSKPKPLRSFFESDEDNDDSEADAGRTTRRNNSNNSSSEEDSDEEPISHRGRSSRSKICSTEKENKDGSQSNDDNDDVKSSKPVLRKRKASTLADSSESESNDDSSSSATEGSEDQSYSQEFKRKKTRQNVQKVSSRSKSRKKSRDRKRGEKKSKKTGRKQIKKIITADQVTDETKDAEKREEERRKRLEMRGDDKIVEVDLDNSFNIPEPVTKRLVLQKDPLVEVHPAITMHLKPHQVEGVQFIWDNLVESTNISQEGSGGGCILAHCMGLGKTLQTITSIHTILRTEELSIKTVLVVAPLNTLLNWMAEFERWAPDDEPIMTYNLADYGTRKERLKVMEKWSKTGGVMVLGYDMFRLLASGVRIRYKAWKERFAHLLLDPGPDIVVCDEGHKLKNSESNISIVMNKLKTKRRLVLTGTPLQNNLIEYQCMVNFVKPNLLGSIKEFRNRFVNPISNGQHLDSTERDVRLMKKRSHVLHDMLQGFVQRKDYTSLAQYLCGKYEFIIKVRLSPMQVKLYRHYLDTMTNRGSDPHAVVQGSKDTGLFSDYQNLMRIWTHPRVLQLHTIRRDEQLNRMMTDTEDEAVSSDEEWNRKEDKEHKEEGVSKEEEGSKEEKEKGPPQTNGNTISLLNDSDEEITKAPKPRRSKRMKDSSEEDAEEQEESASSSSEDEFRSEGSEEETESASKKRNRSRRYRLRGGASDSSDNDPMTQLNKSIESAEESNEWYSSIVGKDGDAVDAGGKVAVLFEILRLAHQCDDKVLVFSQSLLSLDLIEEMLALSTVKVLSQSEGAENGGTIDYRKWYKNLDYFRMDGSSLGKSRQRWINEFNDETDRRARLFLISTKAGSLGVNLVAANRVVIFDASWNPTHDIQSIFRVYRFGQVKCCFIYRLIAQGTMEEKIYDRQVTKQSLAFRVVDEQQINRHFTAHDLQELYNFTPSPVPEEGGRPTHALPKDPLLAELLVGEQTRDMIASYHQHESLLDHQEAEELTEEERKAAWEEYENEKKGLRVNAQQPPPRPGIPRSRPGQMVNSFNPMSLFAPDIQDPVGIAGQEDLLSDEVINSLLLPKPLHLNKDQKYQAQSVVALMLKATRSMHQSAAKLQFLKPVDHEKTMTNLKAMPMYRHMKEDSLRMIVLELQIRQQQQRANAEKDFKTSKMQLSWLESRYRKTVQDAANLNGMIALAKAAANGPNSIINLTLDTESDNAMKSEASGFARSSFQSMLNQQNKQITSAPAEAKASGSTPHLTDSSALTTGADKGAKPLTIDLTEADSEHPASVIKPTDHKPPLPINVDPTSLVEASAKKATPPSRVNENGKKKASYEISEDSENEDDWEATYSRNARNRSRRTRS